MGIGVRVVKDVNCLGTQRCGCSATGRLINRVNWTKSAQDKQRLRDASVSVK